MSSNFSVLGNTFASTFVQVQCEPNAQYQALVTYLTGLGLGGNHARDIAIMGVNSDPNNGSAFASAPFLLTIVPTFVPFSIQNQPSHLSASIIGYFTSGIASYNAVITTVNHNPVQITDFTLVELDPQNNIITTKVTRQQVQGSTPEALAQVIGMANITQGQWNSVWPTFGQTDIAAVAGTALGNLATDDYEGPLYGAAGLATLLNDSTTSSIFAQAVSLRTSVAQGVTALAGSSSSCAGSSCSTTSVIAAAQVKSGGFGGFGGGKTGGGGAGGSW